MTASTEITQLLTDRDVAALTGLARSTLAKLRLSGEGPRFIKLGASVRYRVDDVQIWVAAQPRRRSTSDTSPK
jgi:predicted DNA-binding transcriptional regulator AlpA